MLFPTLSQADVPHLSTEQMIEVDRAMMEDYRIDLMQMMENAGRNLAHLARVRFLDGNPREKSVVFLAGTGGNGGGALVCARRLHNWGAKVSVFITKSPHSFTPVPAHQTDILRRMGIAISPAQIIDDHPADLIIDGIIGYSLRGNLRSPAADMITWATIRTAPTFTRNVPLCINTDDEIQQPAIRAAATLTLALPKIAFRVPAVSAYLGELYLADISVPPKLYTIPSLGLVVGNLFAQNDIVRLK